MITLMPSSNQEMVTRTLAVFSTFCRWRISSRKRSAKIHKAIDEGIAQSAMGCRGVNRLQTNRMAHTLKYIQNDVLVMVTIRAVGS